jgi:hypothetical protein
LSGLFVTQELETGLCSLWYSNLVDKTKQVGLTEGTVVALVGLLSHLSSSLTSFSVCLRTHLLCFVMAMIAIFLYFEIKSVITRHNRLSRAFLLIGRK